MKGDLHRRVQAQLHAAWKNGAFKQESLRAVMGKSQRSVSQYLNGDVEAGALDLDEADAALRHVGSSLAGFLAEAPPRTLTDAERLGQVIEERPGLRRVVELLLAVPKTRLDAVAELIRTVVLPATARAAGENAEHQAAPTKARRTTKARATHR